MSLEQLHRKARGLAESHLADDEVVVTVLAGRSKQAMIVTDRQLLIVKTGFMAGMPLSAKAGSFPLAKIDAINLHVGRGVAALELVVAGQTPPGRADLRAAYHLSNWLPCPPSLGDSPMIGELRTYVQSDGRSRSARAELSAYDEA